MDLIAITISAILAKSQPLLLILSLSTSPVTLQLAALGAIALSIIAVSIGVFTLIRHSLKNNKEIEEGIEESESESEPEAPEPKAPEVILDKEQQLAQRAKIVQNLPIVMQKVNALGIALNQAEEALEAQPKDNRTPEENLAYYQAKLKIVDLQYECFQAKVEGAQAVLDADIAKVKPGAVLTDERLAAREGMQDRLKVHQTTLIKQSSVYPIARKKALLDVQKAQTKLDGSKPKNSKKSSI